MKGFVTALAMMLALLLTGCGSRNADQQSNASSGTQATEDHVADQTESGDAADETGNYEADSNGVVEDDRQTDGDDLSDDLQDAVDDTADAARDVTDGAEDAVNGVVDGAGNVANDVIDGVDDVTDGVGDATQESETAR